VADRTAEGVLVNTLEIIKEELEQGKAVMISGFGKWSVLKKKARRGRNPHTGEAIAITGRRVVSFKESPKLKKTLQESVESNGL